MKIRPVKGQLFHAEGQRTDRQTYDEADSHSSLLRKRLKTYVMMYIPLLMYFVVTT